jgi:hypothetical protein
VLIWWYCSCQAARKRSSPGTVSTPGPAAAAAGAPGMPPSSAGHTPMDRFACAAKDTPKQGFPGFTPMVAPQVGLILSVAKLSATYKRIILELWLTSSELALWVVWSEPVLHPLCQRFPSHCHSSAYCLCSIMGLPVQSLACLAPLVAALLGQLSAVCMMAVLLSRPRGPVPALPHPQSVG